VSGKIEIEIKINHEGEVNRLVLSVIQFSSLVVIQFSSLVVIHW
jgi:hypothetical protein